MSIKSNTEIGEIRNHIRQGTQTVMPIWVTTIEKHLARGRQSWALTNSSPRRPAKGMLLKEQRCLLK